MLSASAVASFAFASVAFAFQKRHKDFGQWWNNAGWLVFVGAMIVATAVLFRFGWVHDTSTQ